MAKKPIQVTSLKHDDATRKNIPIAELESVMRAEDKTPIQLAYERRNCDLDPQLVWRGKDEQDWSDLIVAAPPLYIQEKVDPQVLIEETQAVWFAADWVSGSPAYRGFEHRLLRQFQNASRSPPGQKAR